MVEKKRGKLTTYQTTRNKSMSAIIPDASASLCGKIFAQDIKNDILLVDRTFNAETMHYMAPSTQAWLLTVRVDFVMTQVIFSCSLGKNGNLFSGIFG